jgi:S1-C subfamily serine protease
MFFFTGLHPDYHRVSDHVERLTFDNIVKIGRTAALMVWELATTDERGRMRPPGFGFRPEPPSPSPKRRLGIVIDETLGAKEMDRLGLPAGEGAIGVSSVSQGSAAEVAGIRTGDVIVRFAGRPFARSLSDARSQLQDRIAAAKAGEPVEAIVLRRGERIELQVKWD